MLNIIGGHLFSPLLSLSLFFYFMMIHTIKEMIVFSLAIICQSSLLRPLWRHLVATLAHTLAMFSSQRYGCRLDHRMIRC